jgi:hypothetical protein
VGLGERSLEAKRRHGAAPDRGWLPAPAPVPSVPPALRGPGAPRPAPPRPARPAPLPRGVYPTRSLCAPARLAVTPEGNPKQWEGRGPRTHRPGRTRMLTSLEASYRGQGSERTGPPAGTPLPSPTTLVPHLDPAGHSSIPVPTGSARKAFFSLLVPLCGGPGSPRTNPGDKKEGRRGQPRLPRDRGEPHYSGLARDARLLEPSDSLGTPRACSPLPSGTSLITTVLIKLWRDTAASKPGACSCTLGGRPGKPRRPGRRICLPDGNFKGARCVRSAHYPRLSLEHLLSPRRPDLLSRAGLTPARGNQSKVSSLQERGRARKLILVIRLLTHLAPRPLAGEQGRGLPSARDDAA